MSVIPPQAPRDLRAIAASTDPMSPETDDLEADEVDLALLALIEMGEENGVTPSQMLRLIRDRVDVASELADMTAEYSAFDEMPKSLLVH